MRIQRLALAVLFLASILLVSVAQQRLVAQTEAGTETLPVPQAAPTLLPPQELVSARTGRLPMPLDLSHLKGDQVPDGWAAQPLPAQWDWRNQGAVTTPKNQGACGSCYAQAAIGGFESQILLDGGPIYDFSENHAKECNWEAVNGFTHNGFAWGTCNGGLSQVVANLWSQTGTVLESCDPYVPSDVACKTGCPYQKTLLDWRLVTGRSIPNPDVLKHYILNFGPVASAINAGHSGDWASEFENYNGSYTLHYTGAGSTNHDVLLIGWDDGLTHSGGQGAWIAKNSWGTAWGDHGFFYIAYGSAQIGTNASYIHDYQDYDPAGGLLLYDEAGGWWNARGFGDTTAWSLSKFVPGADGRVTRIEFWTADATRDVDLYLYGSFDGTRPSDLLYSRLDLSYNEAGYISVPVDREVQLSRGDDIIVVAKFTNASYNYPIATDGRGAPVTGRTFVSHSGNDGTWQDLGSAAREDVAVRLRWSSGTSATPTATRTTAATTPTLIPTRTRTPTQPLPATATPTEPSTGCLAESAHPYANDTDQTWTLTNPDTRAQASRIHFSRLETEASYDVVIVRDGAGQEVQRFDGSHPGGIWTVAVPGRTIQVQLVSDFSITEWGFCVDQIQTAQASTCLAESPHPYPDFFDRTWTIVNPDPSAASSKIHFSRLETEERYDYVIIRDAAGNAIQLLDGLYDVGLWSDEVPGRTVLVQLTSDYSVSEWGFCVDEIVASGTGATPTVTTIPGAHRVVLPAVLRRPSAGSWVSVLREDFEGTFPGLWDVGDSSGMDWYLWDKRDCRAYAGSFSGWPVGGGAFGQFLSCGSSYPDDVETWMVYGPFSISDATAAEVTFQLWANTEEPFDEVLRAASADGVDFAGFVTSGYTGGWIQRALDFGNVPWLGDLTGQPQVWFALGFSSDENVNMAEGAYVDDILLRKYVPGAFGAGPVSSSTSQAMTGEGWVDEPVRVRLPVRP